MAPTSMLLWGRPLCVPSTGHSALRCSQSDRIRLGRSFPVGGEGGIEPLGTMSAGVGGRPSRVTLRAPHLRLGPASGGGAAPAAPSDPPLRQALSPQPPAPSPQLPAPSPAPGSAGWSRRGGVWVSVSCNCCGDREIEEFPGTTPGAQRFTSCRWPRRRWGEAWRREGRASCVARAFGSLEVPVEAGKSASEKPHLNALAPSSFPGGV